MRKVRDGSAHAIRKTLRPRYRFLMSEWVNTTGKFMRRNFFLIGMLAAFLSISACSSQYGMDNSPANTATSTISANPVSGTVPLVVHFDGLGSSDSIGSISSY